MGAAVERLTRLVHDENRYDIPADELRDGQIEAMNERLQERRDAIKLVGFRAAAAGLDEVRTFEDMVPLLLPHTAYKSYPEAWLLSEKWDRMSKWLDTVSTHRIPIDKLSCAADMDDWIERLASAGFFVSCSSGTTGKSAMLVATRKDMEWVKVEAVSTYLWGSKVKPLKDRRIFPMAAVARQPRVMFSGEGYTEALQDPNHERFTYPVPPITVGGLTQMVMLRKMISDGTAKPRDIEVYEELSSARQKEVDNAVGITARAVIDARREKLHITGMWLGLYNVAKAVRELGYSAKDFDPDNSFAVAGGLKGAKLPEDYKEFVYQTFNISPDRTFQNYSMQELHSGMPLCQAGGRYHLPPWLVPLILDKSGERLLPLSSNEYEGRAAFFDLSIEGRWGGVISGDRVSIDFSPCACGAKGPSIRDEVVRYSDIEGDDKIGCAGTVDAYVRGIA